jgi:hypothetical protein
MKKLFFLVLALLVIAAILIGTHVEGPSDEKTGDENYHGEDDEQPGDGVDTGPGDTNVPDSPGNRTRFKDR